jgi:hypothetical protein
MLENYKLKSDVFHALLYIRGISIAHLTVTER